MADNFDFAALTKSWQQQNTPTEQLPQAADLTHAKRRQHKQKWLMYGEWLGAVVMLVAACWLAFVIPGWLGYLSALFLALGAISSAYVGWTVHRPILAYDNWSSSGLVKFRRQACQLSLRYYRYTQLSCVALVLFTLILWLLQLTQLDNIPLVMRWFYSLLVSPLCLFASYRLQLKIRQKTAELAQLDNLAQDFQHAE